LDETTDSNSNKTKEAGRKFHSVSELVSVVSAGPRCPGIFLLRWGVLLKRLAAARLLADKTQAAPSPAVRSRRWDILGFSAAGQHRQRTHIERQEQAENSPVPFGQSRRPQAQVASIAAKNGSRDPQAKTGAALSLGREKRLAESIAYFRRNARSIVADGEPQPLRSMPRPAPGGTNADHDASALRTGLDSIGDQIGNHLPHFAREDRNALRAF